MKFLVVLAAVAAVATCWDVPSAQEVANQWQRFKAAHGKTYANDVEEAHRIKIFKENLVKIAKHNERFDAGEVTYKVGVNKFSDMLTHERKGLRGYRSGVKHADRTVHQVTDDQLSWPWTWPWPWTKQVDWRTKGRVTPVKTHGDCQCDWAFSATGVVEGQLAKKTGKLVSLSEQNLVDCTWEYHNAGCEGGDMSASFDYIRDNGGIDTEESYPYEAKEGTCRYSKDNSAGTATGPVVNIPAGSEKALEDAVRKVGPVAVAVDSAEWGFEQYESGIYYQPECTVTGVDHPALVVGFGSEGPGKDYWIVKNHWGPSWGEEGYIRMARNKDNNCGIASEAVYTTA